MDAEGAYWYHAHPRTKGTTGYPDLIFDKAWTKNDRYLGVAFKPGMGMDLSEARMCEWRCFDVTDTMNNLYAGSGLRPEIHHRGHRHLSEGTRGRPLSELPGELSQARQSARSRRRLESRYSTALPQRRLLRDDRRDPDQELQGRRQWRRRTIVADVEWTFPLSFVEVVWGDGKKIDRQIISRDRSRARSAPSGSAFRST